MHSVRLRASFFVMLAAFSCCAAQTADYTVSVTRLRNISSHERIVSFEINCIAGAIRSVANLPIGWNVVIDNDPSWQTKVKATTIIGAASLSPEDLRKVKITVTKNEFGDLKFGVSGVVSVTTDYTTERHIQLGISDLTIGPAR